MLQPRGDPRRSTSAVQAQGRHRRAARQPRARRRRDQAVGGDAGADEASRPRGGVREHRGLHKRASTTRRSISTTDCVMVLKRCGPKGYPGMPEVGNMPLPQEAAEEGHHRHGAHLRRAHERHRLWHRGAARRAGGGGSAGRWPWCENGDMIELDVREAAPASRCRRGGTGAPPRRLASAGSARVRLSEPLRPQRPAG